MDQPLSNSHKRNVTIKQVLRIILIAVIPLLLILFFKNIFTPRLKYDLVTTAKVKTGDISVTVSGAGVVIPNYEEVIGAPFRSKIIRIYRQPGDKVLKGDTIMVLDNEIALIELERLRNELELMMIRKNRREIELKLVIEDFKISKEIKDLKIDALKLTYKNESYMYSMGGSPKEDMNKAEAEMKIAMLELKQATTNHENDVNSRTFGLKEIDTEMRIQRTLIKDAEIIVSQAYVTIPFDGDLSWIHDNPGVLVNEGTEIARVADISKFKLSGRVSNSWAGRILTGQKVIIRDKENILEGQIENISPSVSDGMLGFLIRIESGNMKNLRPNQQLEIRVVLSYKDNVLRIPNGAYYTDRGYKDMYVILNDKAFRVKVLLGDANFDYVEIVEGLNENEEVVLSDVAQKYEREELKVKY